MAWSKDTHEKRAASALAEHDQHLVSNPDGSYSIVWRGIENRQDREKLLAGPLTLDEVKDWLKRL